MAWSRWPRPFSGVSALLVTITCPGIRRIPGKGLNRWVSMPLGTVVHRLSGILKDAMMSCRERSDTVMTIESRRATCCCMGMNAYQRKCLSFSQSLAVAAMAMPRSTVMG